jgi:hypothetical protein
MLKKYALIGILGAVVVLALSAFSSISYQPAAILSLSIAPVGFQTPAMSDLGPSIALTGFRTPAMSDLAAPSIALTGFRTPAMSDLGSSIALTGFRTPAMSDFVASSDASNFRIAHTWNGIYVPSMDVTGQLKSISQQYQYGPAKSATGSLGVAQQYQYGPASLATGFAAVSGTARLVPLAELYSLKAVTGAKVAAKTGFIAAPASKTSVVAFSALVARVNALELQKDEIFSTISLKNWQVRLDALELQKDVISSSALDARLARIDALELQKDVIP